MDYTYGQYDGQPFKSPDDLFASPELIGFILHHGQDALDAMDGAEGDEAQSIIDQLLESGLMDKDPQTGKLRLTPRMVRGMQHRALLEIFRDLHRGNREGHESRQRGQSPQRAEGTRPYEFGDPISEVDLTATLRSAIARQKPDELGRVRLPLRLTPGDLEVHLSESQADVATCILLDMSGSMMRWQRFFQAKRVAMGLAELVRQRFPQDTLDYVGFYTLARAFRESELPLLTPKPVSIFEPSVRLRMPLDQAEAQEERLPLHFTNLQLGLRRARHLLRRRGAANKQVFIITDGQPTAHVESPEGGAETLHLLYPPSPRTSEATLAEALRCRQEGIRFASFALVEDYWAMDWVGFVDQLTRLTRGTSFYCSSDDLSSTVIESYLSGKKTKRVAP